ncbi:probable methyltransferase-like protein 25 [Bombus affinis]|uniref:probable methyltransferase-like protein 25 n=1 Tax=Bombus affinis TaxID=309941 RepID=UPI0021B7D5A3|nr:probable methyltransferase-like protein 25 [Bombus affinis]
MYDKHFNEIIYFINTYHKLVNCHIVDFITENLWTTCLPEALRSELEKNELSWVSWTENDNYPTLNNFIKLAKSLSLQSCSIETNSKDFLNTLPDINNHKKCTCKNIKIEFINTKKLHEVESLGNIIGEVAARTNNLVIDAGAGKAYLSTFLAENHKVPVLAIDSSQLCSNGAICRQKKLQKKLILSPMLVRYVVEEINDRTDYIKMIKENFSDWDINKNLILTGLHTCGSLTDSIIRTFLATKDINILCIVPCCYHLTNETLNKKINFSRNARMLAQQSVERSTKNKSVPSSLFYRAILQVIFHSLGIYNARVGRGGPSHDFPSYAQWAFSRIGVDLEKIPSREALTKTFQLYAHLMKKFYIFQMLRIHVGLVLEAAIMLDRIIFLQNSNQCSKIAILRLFDPMLSPRRYGIIAVK